jgi:hypothetical protein
MGIDIEGSLMDLGKEEALKFADSYLSEQAQTGGLEGTAIGAGKEFLDNAIGGGHESDERGEEGSSADDSNEDSEGDNDSDGDEDGR